MNHLHFNINSFHALGAVKQPAVIQTDPMDTTVYIGNKINRNSEDSGNLDAYDNTRSERSTSNFPLVETTDDKESSILFGEDELDSHSSLKREDADSGEESESQTFRKSSESGIETTNEKKLDISEKNENNGVLQ